MKKEPDSHSTAKSLEDLIDFESNRIYKLFKSIRNNGYSKDHEYDDDVVVYLLLNEKNEHAWLLFQGFHRCSVCYTLSYDTIEVKLNNIICRNNVDL